MHICFGLHRLCTLCSLSPPVLHSYYAELRKSASHMVTHSQGMQHLQIQS